MGDVPALLAQAVCDDLQLCLGALYATSSNGEDCVKSNRAAIEQGSFSLLQAAIDAKRVSYHGDKVDGCLAALNGVGCSIFGNRLPHACDDVFTGSVADGQDCTLNEECTGNSVCIFDAACPGKCAVPSAIGGKCDSNDDCQDGLECNSTAYTCEKIPGVGDACGADQPGCAVGTLCIGADATTGTAGTCKAYDNVFQGKQGESCDFATGKLCQAGLACEVVDLATQPPTETCVKPVASGAACKAAGPDECPGGEYCEIPAGTYAGTCTKLPASGSACGSGAFSATPCAPYTRCDTATGKCVDRANDGASCSSDDICTSGHCEKGTCQATQCG